MNKTAKTICFTSTFWILIGAIIFFVLQKPIESPPPPDPVLSVITQEEREFYKSKIVTVTGGNYMGSGCEMEPGYFLSALHIISNAILDNEPIYVDGVEAKIVMQGHTEDDFIILTTEKNPDMSKAIPPTYEFIEGEDFIVTGNPGEEQHRVQTGKVTNVIVPSEDQKRIKPHARKVFAEYIEKGISGGCVYPKGWVVPVGVATKSDNDLDKKRGEISLARKRIK
ncbi:MAG TPA: hypothetical protein PKD34_00405 [Candidatus Doudnabacteria bacterium]|nr:hypothetical protein [Candidatus Doudnabacteria bacterium]